MKKSHTDMVKLGVEHVFRKAEQNAPVVIINRRSLSPAGLAVGFVFDVLPDGIVIATVAHALIPEKDLAAFSFRLITGQELEIRQPLFASNPADDIVFLVAKPIPAFLPIVFGRPENENVFSLTMWNAKNELLNFFHRGYGSPITVFQQTDTRKICDQVVYAPPWREQLEQVQVLSTDSAKIQDYENRGWSKMGYARMVSLHGCSGSPIWDDEWNLYGMDVRGPVDEEARLRHGDVLAYYPASTLDYAWRELKERHRL